MQRKIIQDCYLTYQIVRDSNTVRDRKEGREREKRGRERGTERGRRREMGTESPVGWRGAGKKLRLLVYL